MITNYIKRRRKLILNLTKIGGNVNFAFKRNKYSYSFDSVSLKGCYTKIVTKETFENEYSFVDEHGYFVYDEKHDFVKQDEAGRIYKDSSGKIYYWASSISWDKSGRLLDASGKVIE